MAGVLEHLVAAPRPGVLAGERRRPHRRVLDREGVDEGVGVLQAEALGHLHVAGPLAERGPVDEVGGLDDEGVALPPADRVAQPLPDLGRIVLGVHAHDAGVVHHLDEDDDGVLALHDPLVVVVEGGQHRRARRRSEAEDAPLGVGPLLHVVVGAGGVEARLEPVRGPVVLRAPRRAGLEGRPHGRLTLLGQRREAAVRGVDENRRPPLAVDPVGAGAAVDPERVVAADVPRGAPRPVAALGRRPAVGVAGGVALGHALRFRGRDGRRLLVGQRHRLAELDGPLHGRQRRHVVGARQVRTTARGPGNVAALRRRRQRRQTDQREHAETDRDSSTHLLNPPDNRRRKKSRVPTTPNATAGLPRGLRHPLDSILRLSPPSLRTARCGSNRRIAPRPSASARFDPPAVPAVANRTVREYTPPDSHPDRRPLASGVSAKWLYIAPPWSTRPKPPAFGRQPRAAASGPRKLNCKVIPVTHH